MFKLFASGAHLVLFLSKISVHYCLFCCVLLQEPEEPIVREKMNVVNSAWNELQANVIIIIVIIIISKRFKPFTCQNIL